MIWHNDMEKDNKMHTFLIIINRVKINTFIQNIFICKTYSFSMHKQYWFTTISYRKYISNQYIPIPSPCFEWSFQRINLSWLKMIHFHSIFNLIQLNKNFQLIHTRVHDAKSSRFDRFIIWHMD